MRGSNSGGLTDAGMDVIMADMGIFVLILKEIWHRKVNFVLACLAVVTAVTLFIGFSTAGKASERETARLMLSMGYNMQIKHQTGTRPTGLGAPAHGTTTIRHNVFSKANNASTGGSARPNLLVGHWPLSGDGADDVYEIYGNFFYQNPTGEPLFQGEGNIALYDNLFVNTIASANYEEAVWIVPHNELARRFRDLAGTIKQTVAALADAVVFMVSGVPLVVKGADPAAAGPDGSSDEAEGALS